MFWLNLKFDWFIQNKTQASLPERVKMPFGCMLPVGMAKA